MATVLAFDREMAAELGVNAALLYQELKRKQHYWKSQGKLEDGFFYCDQGEIAEWILVHPNTVGKAAKALEDAGYIEKKVSYRPGTLTPTTWWKVVDDSESTPKVISSNHSESDYHIKSNTSSNAEGGREDEAPIIPFAAPTTRFVEVETFDSDDNGKTIVVERKIPRKSWNSAVKIWRNDESKFARVEFEDEPGKMTSIRPSQLKSWNVRPKIGGSVNQYNGGTAFQG